MIAALIAISFACGLASSALAQSATTEIVLEEGHAEIQLSNGVFIGLSAGADVRIEHDEAGDPTSVEVRAGAVQLRGERRRQGATFLCACDEGWRKTDAALTDVRRTRGR